MSAEEQQINGNSGLGTTQDIDEDTRQNIDALATSAPDGAHIKKPRSEPLTTHGHKPGVLSSEADRAPSFHLETLPAGTAPADRTFEPQPSTNGDADTAPPAADYPGATSADVHTGLGHPGQGQTSSELRHDGAHGRKKQTAGLEGVGARVGDGDRDGEEAQDGGVSLNIAGAEEKEPQGAEAVAAEFD